MRLKNEDEWKLCFMKLPNIYNIKSKQLSVFDSFFTLIFTTPSGEFFKFLFYK